jgi:hypothetical protein
MEEHIMQKENTHIVLKKEDVARYLTEPERRTLGSLMDKITRGRACDGKQPVNSYYVCNRDEPYAEAVHSVILDGEESQQEQNHKVETENERDI